MAKRSNLIPLKIKFINKNFKASDYNISVEVTSQPVVHGVRFAVLPRSYGEIDANSNNVELTLLAVRSVPRKEDVSVPYTVSYSLTRLRNNKNIVLHIREEQTIRSNKTVTRIIIGSDLPMIDMKLKKSKKK